MRKKYFRNYKMLLKDKYLLLSALSFGIIEDSLEVNYL